MKLRATLACLLPLADRGKTLHCAGTGQARSGQGANGAPVGPMQAAGNAVLPQCMAGRTQRGFCRGLLAALAVLPCLAAGLAPGAAGAGEPEESLVLLRTSYLAGNRTEENFVRCVAKKIRSGGKRPVIHAERQFVDDLYPWLEPRTMPRESADLGDFMARPGVADAIRRKGVRYMVWLSGQTLREGRGGSLSCAAGPGGAGCFGVAWWQNNSEYTASVWDLSKLSDMGDMKAAVRGTSVIPALVIPIPIISRTREKACDSIAGQIRDHLNLD